MGFSGSRNFTSNDRKISHSVTCIRKINNIHEYEQFGILPLRDTQHCSPSLLPACSVHTNWVWDTQHHSPSLSLCSTQTKCDEHSAVLSIAFRPFSLHKHWLTQHSFSYLLPTCSISTNRVWDILPTCLIRLTIMWGTQNCSSYLSIPSTYSVRGLQSCSTHLSVQSTCSVRGSQSCSSHQSVQSTCSVSHIELFFSLYLSIQSTHIVRHTDLFIPPICSVYI